MTETYSHNHKNISDLRMPKKDSIIPLSGLFPLRDIDGWIPYSLKNDDRNHVGIAILGHYGELYFRNGSAVKACSSIAFHLL